MIIKDPCLAVGRLDPRTTHLTQLYPKPSCLLLNFGFFCTNFRSIVLCVLFSTLSFNISVPPSRSSNNHVGKLSIAQAQWCAACRGVPFHRACHRKAAAQQTHKPPRLPCCNTSHPCIASRAALPAGQPR